jgi:hypothetical protein
MADETERLLADETDRLLAELAEATLGCRLSKRLRLAVTPDEYRRVRQHMLDRDGRFYRRVRTIPLVTDDYATKPPFFIEVADGELCPENQGRQGAQGRQDDGRVQGGRPEELLRREGDQPQAGDSD